MNIESLYPNEQLIWNPHYIPENKNIEEGSLAIFKLNLQFLTLNEYLIRNYHLYKLESTFALRDDFQQVIYRMNAQINNRVQVDFYGSSRKGLAVQDFKITTIEQPKVKIN